MIPGLSVLEKSHLSFLQIISSLSLWIVLLLCIFIFIYVYFFLYLYLSSCFLDSFLNPVFQLTNLLFNFVRSAVDYFNWVFISIQYLPYIVFQNFKILYLVPAFRSSAFIVFILSSVGSVYCCTCFRFLFHGFPRT